MFFKLCSRWKKAAVNAEIKRRAAVTFKQLATRSRCQSTPPPSVTPAEAQSFSGGTAAAAAALLPAAAPIKRTPLSKSHSTLPAARI